MKLVLGNDLRLNDTSIIKTQVEKDIKLADKIYVEAMYVEGAYTDGEYENIFKGCEKERFETIEEAYKAFLERISNYGINESHIQPFPQIPEIDKEYEICNRYLSIKLLFKEVS